MKSIFLLEQERIVNLDISLSLKSAGFRVLTHPLPHLLWLSFIPDLLIIDRSTFTTLDDDSDLKKRIAMMKHIPVILTEIQNKGNTSLPAWNLVARIQKPFNSSVLTGLCLQHCPVEISKIA